VKETQINSNDLLLDHRGHVQRSRKGDTTHVGEPLNESGFHAWLGL